MAYVSIERLLESGAHFGHLTRRWNPRMRPFIHSERNGIHIIDLRKTQLLIDIARDAAREVAERGQKFLFVGTKKQAKVIIGREAERSNSYYVADRWLGGMLTNFTTIRKSIRRLDTIEKMETDGTFEKLRKKERLMLTREREKLNRVFSGIRDMTRLPGALFVVDIKKEHIAIKEARKLGIPVFAMVDTNCDPMEVQYPIPANDDSLKAIEIVTKALADGVKEGGEVSRIRRADESASGEREFKEDDGGNDGESAPAVRRKMRSRGGRRNEGGEKDADAANGAVLEHEGGDAAEEADQRAE